MMHTQQKHLIVQELRKSTYIRYMFAEYAWKNLTLRTRRDSKVPNVIIFWHFIFFQLRKIEWIFLILSVLSVNTIIIISSKLCRACTLSGTSLVYIAVYTKCTHANVCHTTTAVLRQQDIDTREIPDVDWGITANYRAQLALLVRWIAVDMEAGESPVLY